MAKQVIEYLKANPEAAQQSYEQAHRMLRTPGMAQMMLDAKVRALPSLLEDPIEDSLTSPRAAIPHLSSAKCKPAFSGSAVRVLSS